MSRILPEPSAASPRQQLAEVRPRMAKALKKVEIGPALDRAIALANRTQKEVWVALGHGDGARLNRWIAGTERPQFDALFAILWLQKPLVIALAELAGEGVEIETVVRVKVRA